MIITVDNSDAVSTTNTLVVVTKESEKLPRFFSALTYASLGLSFVPFGFSLVIVQISRINSIPTILAYFFSTPFHVVALLLIWQQSRQIDMQLPFRPSSRRNIAYLVFLAAMWLFAMITSGMGAHAFLSATRVCMPVRVEDGMSETCDDHYAHNYQRTVGLLATAALLEVLEALILCAMVVICFRSRPRKETLAPTSSSPSAAPSPKVLSA